jgi:hypothetical protein
VNTQSHFLILFPRGRKRGRIGKKREKKEKENFDFFMPFLWHINETKKRERKVRLRTREHFHVLNKRGKGAF